MTFDVARAETAATVQLLRDGHVIASRTGPGPLTDPGPLPSGAYTFRARQVDPSGKLGIASAALIVVVDTSAAPPSVPDLQDASDSGASNTDNLTNNDRPTFDVTTAEPGASVQLLRNGSVVAARLGPGAIQDPGPALSDGTYAYTARQIDIAGNMSSQSGPLIVTVDTTPPTATIAAVTPNPRSSSVSTVDVTFSEPIDLSTFKFDDLALTRDGNPITLTGGITTTAGSGSTYHINGLDSFTSAAGTYVLTVSATGIKDSAGNAGSGSASTSWTVTNSTTTYPQLAGPWFFNGNQPAQIQQNGASLTFINERGESSPGSFLSATQVVATGWGNLVGTLVPTADGMRIAWANGTAWDQLRLAGQGVIGNRGIQINQDGNSLTFINEFGGTSPGYIADVNHVVATGWGNLVGTLSPTFAGFRISWANGTAWDLLRLAGTWSINGSQTTQVVQPGNGTALTFINEFGGTSAGYIQDNSHVVATGWGNLVGTLVQTAQGVRINWSNGTAWDQVRPGG